MVVLNADFELSSFVIVVVVETVQMRDTITFLFISGFAGIEHFLIFFFENVVSRKIISNF